MQVLADNVRDYTIMDSPASRVLPFLLLLTAVCLMAVALQAAPLTPPFTPDQQPQWHFASGNWRFSAEGTLEQTNASRRSAAVLRSPAYGNIRLTADFRIAPVGGGVRAAAVIFGATGTLSYHWLHLDSRFHQIILTRSTPKNTWIEIARRRCPALTDDTWHKLVVEARGDAVKVLLDGQEALQAPLAEPSAGYVGFGTSQGQVAFRNLMLEGDVVNMAQLKDEQPPFRIISHGEAAGTYQAFPDACRLENGDIMAVFYGGYGHVSLPNAEWPKGGRICTVRSSDEGWTWSEPTVLYDDPLDNRDPHIAQLSDGTLVCSFFNYWREDGKTRYHCLLAHSTDGGKTWEQQGQVVTPLGWAVSAPVREMPDGTLILGVYSEGPHGSFGGVIRSTDHGKTWSAPIPIGEEARLPLDAETDVILLKDKTLYAALRSSKVNMHYATSPDLGLTWSEVKDIGFKAHAPHFTRLSTGEILMTHRIPETALHVSRDEAQTWEGPYVLDTVGGAYPATVELKDGTILGIYYEEGEGSAIRALRFRLKADGIEPLNLDK